MKRWKKILWITVSSLLLVMLTAIIFVTVYINRTVPLTNGEIVVDGLNETVSVIRDENGKKR